LIVLAAKYSLLSPYEWEEIAEILRDAGVTISPDQLAQLAKRDLRVVIR
jgi:hypothetical protein